MIDAGRARTACCSCAGATHPFADWRVQDIYPDERYLQVVEDMQLVARVEPDLRPARARRHRGPRDRAST